MTKKWAKSYLQIYIEENLTTKKINFNGDLVTEVIKPLVIFTHSKGFLNLS